MSPTLASRVVLVGPCSDALRDICEPHFEPIAAFAVVTFGERIMDAPHQRLELIGTPS
jgi:hypothetical protein